MIEDSPKEKEKLVSLKIKGEEGTSKQASPNSPITDVRRPVTRSKLAKQDMAPLTPFQKGEILLQDPQIVLQETLLALQETQKKKHEGQKG